MRRLWSALRYAFLYSAPMWWLRTKVWWRVQDTWRSFIVWPMHDAVRERSVRPIVDAWRHWLAHMRLY